MNETPASLRVQMGFQYFIAALFLGFALVMCAGFVLHAIKGTHEKNIVGFGVVVWMLQLVGFAALRGGHSTRAEIKAGPSEFRTGRLWEVGEQTLPSSASDPPEEAAARADDTAYGIAPQSGRLLSGTWIMRAAHVIAVGALVIGFIGMPFTEGNSLLAIAIGLPLAFLCYILAMLVSKLES